MQVFLRFLSNLESIQFRCPKIKEIHLHKETGEQEMFMVFVVSKGLNTVLIIMAGISTEHWRIMQAVDTRNDCQQCT